MSELTTGGRLAAQMALGRNGNPFVAPVEPPWCNGCSYTQLTAKIQAVLAEGFDPGRVVLSTDIGCIGVGDKLYLCDTVHGLHGRSIPLGAGLKLAHADPELKVVVIIGDGGCSIGLQHLIETARLNVDLTVLAFDNQNYGMTGGQHSTFTLPEVQTVTTPGGSGIPAMDLVRLLGGFPGVFRARLTANDPRVHQAIEQALRHKGFAYVETLNFCASYAGKRNPSLALARVQQFCEAHGREFGVWAAPEMPTYAFPAGPPAPEAMALKSRPVRFQAALERPFRLVVGGSAGGGVQTAASLFTEAAALSGLHISLKSDYPVTVGKGHSVCEIILSPEPILYAGISHPDLVLLCSEEGRGPLAALIPNAASLVADARLGLEGAESADLRAHGAKNAAFYGLTLMLQRHRWFPPEALAAVVAELGDAKVQPALSRILAEALG